ncbi:hypothetical protein [Halioxenophilus sp. WMMB6]|uniref:hypothetical protein n=1 Tax=Halioxenophilus sp. WMMB6 TaxID=3073815 RepID=UPI00295E2246|nr:hypothetical protein [Halioxenophilus sp. WMMB6]
MTALEPNTDRTDLLSFSDDIDIVISTSNFFVASRSEGKPSLFKEGDRLLVELPEDDKQLPKLHIYDAEDCENKLCFESLDAAWDKTNLSVDSQFFKFGVTDGRGKWRLEIIRQRRPAMLYCKPNNQDVYVQYFFYNLLPEGSSGQLQTTGYDGSGGGWARA